MEAELELLDVRALCRMTAREVSVPAARVQALLIPTVWTGLLTAIAVGALWLIWRTHE